MWSIVAHVPARISGQAGSGISSVHQSPRDANAAKFLQEVCSKSPLKGANTVLLQCYLMTCLFDRMCWLRTACITTAEYRLVLCWQWFWHAASGFVFVRGFKCLNSVRHATILHDARCHTPVVCLCKHVCFDLRLSAWSTSVISVGEILLCKSSTLIYHARVSMRVCSKHASWLRALPVICIISCSVRSANNILFTQSNSQCLTCHSPVQFDNAHKWRTCVAAQKRFKSKWHSSNAALPQSTFLLSLLKYAISPCAACTATSQLYLIPEHMHMRTPL